MPKKSSVRARANVVAAVAVAGVACSFLIAPAATAAPAPLATHLTPSLTSFAAWNQWVSGDAWDYGLTTHKGAPALRMSNAVADDAQYGAITQLSSPAIAAVGETSTGADYKVFTAEFTVDADSYLAQPGLAVEVDGDTEGNRSGGGLVFRQEHDDKLELITYSYDADADEWHNDTAEVAFTGPVKVKYVAQYNDDATDSLKVYVGNVLAIEGEGFEAYHDASDEDGVDKQTIDSLLFRTTYRAPVDGGAWVDAAPSADEKAAIKGHGFYFSGIEYGAAEKVVAPAASNVIQVQTAVTSTPTVGSTLAADVATSAIAPSFSYQWQREGVSIPGATDDEYTLGANDVAKRISLKVIATKTGMLPGSSTSAKTAPVAIGTLAFSTFPTISGTVKVNNTLTANVATTPAATYAYRWFKNGAAISGATATTYKLLPADAGAVFTVRVVASKAGYTSKSGTSAPTDAVDKGALRVGTPTLSGTAKVGSTLTATPGTWTKGTTLKYAFYADGELVQLSTSPKFTATWEEKGAKITVIVIGSLQGYDRSESAESAPRGPVA